ncbi:MAG TPA: monovalent cation/H(+) antiporter subunit G [Isosphaeraceae bacterium]|jgi:multisubunit Na+/H+ antiporter MnhG subunit|nr:monovalent cation/H(+) antiporter subunit G [Isosphaeraceae bacterium]
MTSATVIAAALLAIAVGVVWACAVGLLAARDAFDRLHCVGPVTVLGPIAVAGAVVVAEGPSASALKAILIGLSLLAVGPILTHATARAVRFRAAGGLKAHDAEAGR